ncbi:uncharacterized protein LOC126609682 isoform X3 [Malus sylvestris]|uniref:uncharacterized protein isoform X2 n=1 Tax=Malus domestica TaxID=3750 RepID=UPI0021AC88FC|nr:uncharacterized protein LOC126609682 isoform X3 [Malus sylvestris]
MKKKKNMMQSNNSRTMLNLALPPLDIRVRIAQRMKFLLTPQRHARSKKLLDEGRLKTILNADGKIDEEETPALYAKILANSQGMPRKKSKRQDKNGSKKRTRYGGKQSKGNPAKRRHG